MTYGSDSDNVPMGLSRLPPSASTRDSLQALYEVQKQIGASAYDLHRMVTQLSTMATNHGEVTSHNMMELRELLAESQALLTQIQEQLQDLSGLLPDQFKQIESQIHERLDSFTEFTESATTHQELIAEKWAHIMVAIDSLLDHFGYDPRTLAKRDVALRDQECRWARIKESTISTVIGIVITIVIGLLILAWNKLTTPSVSPINPTGITTTYSR